LQIVAALVTDLLLRAFKYGGGFRGSLYEFVTTRRDMPLTPICRLGSFRQAPLAIAAQWFELPLALPNGKT